MKLPPTGKQNRLTLNKADIENLIKAYLETFKFVFLSNDHVTAGVLDRYSSGASALCAFARVTTYHREIVEKFFSHQQIQELICEFLSDKGYTFDENFSFEAKEGDDFTVTILLFKKRIRKGMSLKRQ